MVCPFKLPIFWFPYASWAGSSHSQSALGRGQGLNPEPARSVMVCSFKSHIFWFPYASRASSAHSQNALGSRDQGLNREPARSVMVCLFKSYIFWSLYASGGQLTLTHKVHWLEAKDLTLQPARSWFTHLNGTSFGPRMLSRPCSSAQSALGRGPGLNLLSLQVTRRVLLIHAMTLRQFAVGLATRLRIQSGSPFIHLGFSFVIRRSTSSGPFSWKSSRGKAHPQSFGDGQVVKSQEIFKNNCKGKSVFSNQDDCSSRENAAVVSSGQQLVGNVGSWQANCKPSFKPHANYDEKLRHSQREGKKGSLTSAGDHQGESNHLNGSIPGKLVGQRDKDGRIVQADKDGRIVQAERKFPFKPKANYYETLEQSHRGGRDKSPVTSAVDRRDSGHSSRSGSTGKARMQRKDEVKGANDTDDGRPHYGYKFRKGGPELGQFRRLGPGKNFAADKQRVGDHSSRASPKDLPHYGYKSRHARSEPDQLWRLSPEIKLADEDGERESLDSRVDGSSRSWQPAKEAHDTGTKELHAQDPILEARKCRPRRLEGEKKWQFSVRKKQLGFAGHSRGSTRAKAQQFVDDEELGDEPKDNDWKQKKVAWLCKHIPSLSPRPLVSILNNQRKWISAVDTKQIVEYLLEKQEILRAHRVLKWEQQQRWYKFDFEITSKVAFLLGQNNKLRRTRDMYDLMIEKGMVPDLPTYTALIGCYIADGENESLEQAWYLYNQMTQLGGHEPPSTLRYNLFQGLVQKGFTFLEQADNVFESIKMAGLVASREMYTSLIHTHGTKGNQDRVDNLVKEMKDAGLRVGHDVFAAVLRACAKDGNVSEGEKAFVDLQMAGNKPIPAVYSSLIKMYTKAGQPEKAFQSFEEMKNMGMSPNLVVYESMMEVAVLSGKREEAENLLQEAQERGIQPLHSCYKFLLELYSRKSLLDEVEAAFLKMQTMKCSPNVTSYNIVLEAYVTHGLVEKAEAFYDSMKAGNIIPDKRTYEVMIKLYGEAKNAAKIDELFRELTSRNLDIPEQASKYLKAAVSTKRLEAHKNSKLKLSSEQREILAGVLLAGAGVESHDRNRTYEIHFSLDPESEVGSCLLKHLYQLFSAWSLEAPTKQPLPDPRDPEKSRTMLAFQTVSHGSFRFFAHQYRPKPKHHAVIPRLVHRWLTPRTLAYWYMYGGEKCGDSGGILLNVDAYSDKEIMLVINALKSRAIDCEKRKKLGLVICFEGKSAKWLWGLMEPFILSEVKYLLKPECEIVSQQMCSNEEEHTMKDSLLLA